MATDEAAPITTKGRLMFGAGFAFGVACAMLLLALVVAALGGEDVYLGAPVILVIFAGVLLDCVIGLGLYMLAFPERRMSVVFGSEPAEE